MYNHKTVFEEKACKHFSCEVGLFPTSNNSIIVISRVGFKLYIIQAMGGCICVCVCVRAWEEIS